MVGRLIGSELEQRLAQLKPVALVGDRLIFVNSRRMTPKASSILGRCTVCSMPIM